MIKLYESPPLPQEWQRHRSRSVSIEQDGVWSSCSRQATICVTRTGSTVMP
jgi:hypothetical protein